MAKKFEFRRGDLIGFGLLAIYGSVEVYCIAWSNAEVERSRKSTLDEDPDTTVTEIVEGELLDTSGGESSPNYPWRDWKPIEGSSEAASIRQFLAGFGVSLDNKTVIEALKSKGISVTASQVGSVRKAVEKAIAGGQPIADASPSTDEPTNLEANSAATTDGAAIA